MATISNSGELYPESVSVIYDDLFPQSMFFSTDSEVRMHRLVITMFNEILAFRKTEEHKKVEIRGRSQIFYYSNRPPYDSSFMPFRVYHSLDCLFRELEIYTSVLLRTTEPKLEIRLDLDIEWGV